MKFDTSKYSRDLSKYYKLPLVKVSLTLVLSIFVITLFLGLALRPTLISITSLIKTIEESQKTYQSLQEKIDNLKSAAPQLEKIKSSLPALNTSIPNKNAGYGDFVSSIEKMALNSGVILDTESLGASLLFSKTVSPFVQEKDHEVLDLHFSLTVKGSYPQIEDFLYSMLSMQRILQIQSTSISPESGRSTTSTKSVSNLKLEITGNTFYLADATQIKDSLVESKGSAK